MNQSKAEAIVARLLTNAAGLRYGSVSVTLSIHAGRITSTVFSVTENQREAEKKADKTEPSEAA